MEHLPIDCTHFRCAMRIPCHPFGGAFVLDMRRALRGPAGPRLGAIDQLCYIEDIMRGRITAGVTRWAYTQTASFATRRAYSEGNSRRGMASVRSRRQQTRRDERIVGVAAFAGMGGGMRRR